MLGLVQSHVSGLWFSLCKDTISAAKTELLSVCKDRNVVTGGAGSLWKGSQAASSQPQSTQPAAAVQHELFKHLGTFQGYTCARSRAGTTGSPCLTRLCLDFSIEEQICAAALTLGPGEGWLCRLLEHVLPWHRSALHSERLLQGEFGSGALQAGSTSATCLRLHAFERLRACWVLSFFWSGARAMAEDL